MRRADDARQRDCSYETLEFRYDLETKESTGVTAVRLWNSLDHQTSERRKYSRNLSEPTENGTFERG